MKRIILLIIFLTSFFDICSATYELNSTQTYNQNSWKTNCADWEIASTTTDTVNTTTSASNSWTFYCLREDSVAPTATVSNEWNAVDSNCDKSDAIVWDQTWAWCNSTVWTTNDSNWIYEYSWNKCYNYSWTNLWWTSCHWYKTKESSYNSSNWQDNIWWKMYSYQWAINHACPSDRHVPSSSEFEVLEEYLYWGNCRTSNSWQCSWVGWKNHTSKTKTNNLIKALNLPLSGRTNHYRWRGAWLWSSTTYSSTKAYVRRVYRNNYNIYRDKRLKTYKLSVRCIKDINWTNSNVTLTITCSDDNSWCDMYSISWWSKNSTNKTYSKTFSSNTSWTITIKDNVWNTKDVSYSVNNIDKTNPTWTVTYSTTEWTNSDVTVTITCSDTTSGCDMYNIDWWTKNTTNKTYSKTFSDNTSWNITIKDLAWNDKSISYSISNIDKTNPTWKIITKTTSSSNAWKYKDTNCNKPDKIIWTQTWASCNSTLGTTSSSNWIYEYDWTHCYNYSWSNNWWSSCHWYNNKESDYNSSKWQDNIWGKIYTHSAALNFACPDWWHLPSDSELETLEEYLYWSNCRTSSSRQCSWLWWKNNTSKDPSNNIIKALELPLAWKSNSYRWRWVWLWSTTLNWNNAYMRRIYYWNNKVYKNSRSKSNKLSVRCIKDHNWTNQNITITIKCSDWESWCVSDNYSRTISSNGDYSTTIIDDTWNETTINYSISNIDKTNPTWTVTYSTTEWTNSDVTATITCSDSASGCDMYNIDWWTKNTTNKTYSKTFSDNTSWNITIKDLAWNSKRVNYSINNIDTTNPSWTVTYSTTGWTNSSVTVTITCSDDDSGCNMINIDWWTKNTTNKTYSKSFSDNTSWSITIKDNVWNTSDISYNINNIDLVAPSWTVVYSNIHWTKNSVTVTITCSDNDSGCNMINRTGWTKDTTNKTYSKSFSSNDSWSITIKDNVWNSKRVNYSITNIDTTSPTWTVTYSTTEWTNSSVTVTITCSDNDSGCNIINRNGWTKNTTNKTYSKSFSSNDSWSITIKDLAWNSKRVNYSINNIDTTPPYFSDISWNWKTLSWTYLIATNDENFDIKVSNAWWSPIKKIVWKFEKFNTRNELWDSFETESDTLTSTFNIQNVDNDRNNNNYRDYTYKITKVCDEAGNCTNDIAEFTYHVHAWQIDDGNSSVDSTEVTNGSVADWSAKELKVTLKDEYWNAVVPVKQSDWTTYIKKINLEYEYFHSLYLDQYKKEGSWIIFSKFWSNITNEQTIWEETISNTINSMNSTWTYSAKFKVYAPTFSEVATDGRQYLNWNFLINKITYSATNWDTWWEFNETIDFQFKPLYSLDFKNDLKDSWIVEWLTQDSILDINKQTSDSINANIYLEFWWKQDTDSLSKLDLAYITSSSSTSKNFYKNYWDNTNISNTTSLWTVNSNTNKDLYTNLIMAPTAYIDDLENVYLSSHLSYNVDRKTVVINQDIIWKDNYDWEYINDFSSMMLKISWKTYSQEWVKFISSENTENDINSISWDINKSIIIKDLKSNIYNNIGNPDYNPVVVENNKIANLVNLSSTENKWWYYIFNNNVIYYNNLNGRTVELDNINDLKITWQKTIIIEWWNLYIKSDMYYNDIYNDILWIVVLKDENGNWWNIYIDPEVTNIVWNIFVEKSIIAYDWFDELDWSNDIQKFKNQLHIFWSVFSFNTLWWSKKSSPECPYYVTDCSEPKIAQKYDLNYLRRYFIKWWVPNLQWKVIWWWRCTKDINDNINCNWWNDLLNHKIDNNHEYYNYNIVIEYNPLIQSKQPPFFSK